MSKLVLGLPKGSLQESTFVMMKKAGFTVRVNSRAYAPSIDDPDIDCLLIRAQEISRYVELGMLDAGITGYDWITENGSDIQEVAELVYAKQGLRPVRWVIAVPETSDIQTYKDLQGKRIATEAVGLTRKFLESKGIEANVEFSWGATEVKPALGLVDAIVELTETGSSLRAAKLRIVDTILESTTRFIANKDAWNDDWKHQKIEKIGLLLQGAIAAEQRVLLKLNVPEEKVHDVAAALPALHAPTINKLEGSGWVAIETVVEESIVRDLAPRLKEMGAEGIIELPLNKVIP